jgi:hypothetical protein
MVISTGEMPFWPIPIRIPEIMNQVRSWAKARHRRPAEKNRPAGIRVAMGPFLSRRMPRAGRATQPMREAAVANTPILAIPSSSRASMAMARSRRPGAEKRPSRWLVPMSTSSSAV